MVVVVVQLRDLKAYGEPGAIVYRVECVELMRLMPAGSVDTIFADLPYRLWGGASLSVRSGRLIPVEKGQWDRSRGLRTHYSAYSCGHTTCCWRGTDSR
jgi:site-specific DNA-methyltransferase (adenine-specific)